MYHTTHVIPEILSQLPRWVRWDLVNVKGGRTTKRPQSSTKTGPWFPLATVSRLLPDGLDPGSSGLGFVMTGPVSLGNGRSLFALDLDGCRNPKTGVLQSWARDVVQAFRSYTEITPSGSGLRILGFVQGGVPALRVIHVPGDVAGGDHLRCEIQVFGHGPASYVTVTGNHLEDTPLDLHQAYTGFEWLRTTYPQATSIPEAEIELHPVGREPSVEELDAAVRRYASPVELDLIDTGAWQKRGFPSASEGWYAIIHLVLARCADHLDASVAWLIEHTAYGQGNVEESKDPSRYSSETWVRADLTRVLGKRRAEVTSVFEKIETNGTAPAAENQRGPFDIGAAVIAPFTVLEKSNGAPTPETAAASTDTFFFESVGALVRRDPRPKWLVRGMVEQDSLVVLSGAPGSYKSFLALDLALALATGQPWHGRAVQAAPVLVLAGEGHGGLARRFQAWFKEYDLDAADVPVGVSRHAGQILDDKAFMFLIAEAKRRILDWKQLPGLIVIDTLNRNFGPGDENSTEDMTKFFEHCDRLRRIFPGVTVMVIHHIGHGATKRSRGSSVLGGTVDAEIILSRDRDKKTDQPKPGARVVFRKMKDAEEPEPFWIVPRFVELGVDDDGESYGSLVIDRVCSDPPSGGGNLLADPEFQADLTAVLQVFQEHPRAGRQDVAKATGVSRRRFEQVVEIALEHGLLEREGRTSDRRHVITTVGVERLEAADDLALVDEDGSDLFL